jgi:hypothetical protein
VRRLATLAAFVAPLAGVAPSALAADPIMPLSAVQPGMSCTALSVVHGITISPFRADVVEVVRGASSSSGARILVRVSGPAVDASGVGPGFSGSPILCRDAAGTTRNIGAISESVGEFGNKVVLATPIEEILGQRPEPPANARAAGALLRRSRPLVGPLTIGGISGRVGRLVARAAERSGRVVLAAPGAPLAGFPTAELRPGSAMAAGISSGDLAIGSIGTVAYRNGSTIWGFGHGIDAAGRRSLPLQDAYVFSVVNNPSATEGAITFKLAIPGRPVGALTNDSASAVVGRLGSPPATIPLRVEVRDLDAGRTSSLSADVADERELELGSGLDLVATLALTQGMVDALGSNPPRLSSRMCVRVQVREQPRRLGFCDTYRDLLSPFADLSTALGLINSFKFGRITPVATSVSMRSSRGVSEAFILSARAPRRVRPGQRIRIKLALQRRRAGRTSMSFRYRIPRSLRPGTRVLTLRGVVPASLRDASEGILEALFGDTDVPGAGDRAGPRSRSDLALQIAQLGRPEGVRASFGSGRGPIVLRSPRLLIRGKIELGFRVVGRRAR